ncbi:hypothetical protein [Mesorhizobium sp. M1136]|uniref:hypothetical protein n=1 Tax=unclassified Mesorhizobium TaxID=325217 RepID=UPI00333C1082
MLPPFLRDHDHLHRSKKNYQVSEPRCHGLVEPDELEETLQAPILRGMALRAAQMHRPDAKG